MILLQLVSAYLLILLLDGMRDTGLILLATGGSAAAAGELVEKLGGTLIGYLFILELDFLKGRDKLSAPVATLLRDEVMGTDR